jgi:hypothetical protein
LKAKWNRFNPFRRILRLKHWVVVLSDSAVLSESGKGMIPAGDLTFLELTRTQKWAQYLISWGEMDTKDIEWTYIGKTTLSEDQIEDIGTHLCKIKLIIGNELQFMMGWKYKIGLIDCQIFAIRLLYQIFPEGKNKSKVRKLAKGRLGWKAIDDEVHRVG